MMTTLPDSLDGISACDSDFTIRKDGVWLYRGSPIQRSRLVRLFATVLMRDATGEYWLKTPVEQCRILVEDRPYIIIDVERKGEAAAQKIEVRTNLDAQMTLGHDHPLAWDEIGPYIAMNNGLSARISRPVYYRLAEWALDDHDVTGEPPGLYSDGVFFAFPH